MTVRPLIEQWFPAQIVGAESLRDASAAKKPPVNRLHVWWARRPLSGSRAAILATLLPAWPSDDEVSSSPDLAAVRKELEAEFPTGEDGYHAWFLESVGIFGDPVEGQRRIAAAKETGEKLADGGYGYPRAFTFTPPPALVDQIHRLAGLRSGKSGSPAILDPFAGGGAIPFESARLGCDTTANELNPVAVAILNATVSLPSTLGPEFAVVLRRYGDELAERVRTRLATFFPLGSADRSTAAFIWAHCVPCPTTGHPTPLAPNFYLASPASGRIAAVRLIPDGASGILRTEVVEGEEAREVGKRSTKQGKAGESVWTGETFGSDYVAQQSADGNLSETLLALAVTRSGKTGRGFRSPTDEDRAAVAAASRELAHRRAGWEADGILPDEPIEHGWKTDEPLRMGLTHWASLFTDRQLLVFGTIMEELRNVIAAAQKEDASTARALALYLSFVVDKALNYNGRLSAWHPARTSIANVFDRHDYAFKWSFGEFDGANGLVPWAVDQVADAFEGMAKLTFESASLLSGERHATASIQMGSAVSLGLPDGAFDAVVTDPPYYDNVMYAECSDYFYVWLKRSLRDTWPELCALALSDKEGEAVANPSLFTDVAPSGRGRRKSGEKTASDLADERYEGLLTRSFKEAHRVLSDNGAMTVMFTHKRVEAWDTLGQALLEAGFAINSSWPVHTESEHSLHQAKKNAASSTIFLTCSKRGSTQPAYWADIRSQVAQAAREAADQFALAGMHGIDLTLSTFGPVLSVLSRNWPVYTGELSDAGDPQILRPDVALNLAREEVARLKKRGLLGGRDVEFDRITDWYLLAWLDFAAAEFPSGEALKLSLATHLELDDLSKQHRVVRATSGSVTILTPAQRRTANALDPDAATWPTMLDGLHALMLTYEEDGLPAAQAWMDRTGKRDDGRFRDLVAAALAAVPRVKEKGEFARPEARTLEGLRATLFDDIPAPVAAEVSVAQAQGQLALG